MGLFFVLLLALNALLDFGYKQFVVDNFNYLSRKDQAFAAMEETPTYLLLGGSHINNSINPVFFKNSFNYGSGNENYAQTYSRLKHILEKQHRIPEYVLVNIDPSSFSAFRSERFKYDAYWIRYMDYFELARIKDNPDYYMKWFTAKFISYAGNYRYLGKLFRLRRRKPGVVGWTGFVPRTEHFEVFPDKIASARERAELYLGDGNYFDKDMALYFQRILDLTRESGVQVILVCSPLPDVYLEALEEIFPLEDLYARVDSMLVPYDHVEVITEFQRKYETKYEYFSNPDHLSFKGANRYSEELYRRMNK